jgi:hypothetical protein
MAAGSEFYEEQVLIADGMEDEAGIEVNVAKKMEVLKLSGEGWLLKVNFMKNK